MDVKLTIIMTAIGTGIAVVGLLYFPIRNMKRSIIENLDGIISKLDQENSEMKKIRASLNRIEETS